MKFISTSRTAPPATVKDAVLAGIAPDGGLYLPEAIIPFSGKEIDALRTSRWPETAATVAARLLGSDLSRDTVGEICERAFDFPLVLNDLSGGPSILELFHGPTAAFKDFGARFMAELVAVLRRGEDRPLTILVATSGDTGSAVAAGFHRAPGVTVVILYPSGRVSPLQEKQLTTWGDNIHAVEVLGSFDECQRLVKEAFRDSELAKSRELSSANSINLARLIPQSLYYAHAALERLGSGRGVPTVVVPSGNFGNLTGAVLAKRLGFPIGSLIAATNANSTVPEFLHGSPYLPRQSVQTVSNAMDVGDPSNMARLRALFETDEALRSGVRGVSVSDTETVDGIRRAFDRFGYVVDPHTAVGLRAVERLNLEESEVIVASTAHPAKFRETVEPAIGRAVELPAALSSVLEKTKVSTLVEPRLDALKSTLERIAPHPG